MGLGGLWHGASYNFLFYGVFFMEFYFVYIDSLKKKILLISQRF